LNATSDPASRFIPSFAVELEGLNMPPSYPSIQSFYRREVPASAKNDEEQQASPNKQGDGFTEEELADVLDPLKRKWNPEREYEETTIDKLIPGPKAVTFVGRIVNLSSIFGSSQRQPKAAGWHYLIVKDDTAAISVCSPIHFDCPELTFIWRRLSYTSLAANILSSSASFFPSGQYSSPTRRKPMLLSSQEFSSMPTFSQVASRPITS
jgi:hypothetical protein